MHAIPAADRKTRHHHAVSSTVCIAILLTLVLPAGVASGQSWSHFDMIRADAEGDYLWHYPENWSDGIPNASISIEIGDDNSRRAIHCVLKTGNAACNEVQLAEHGLTDGSSLTIKSAATLTTNYWTQIGKDECGFLTIEGRMTVARGVELSLGGVWELGGGMVYVLPGGTLVATGRISLNKSRGQAARTSDSRLEISGTVSSGAGMDISSNDPYLPGSVWIGGAGSYTNLSGAVNVEVGSLEVDGPNASISTQRLRFFGGQTVLKLSGNGYAKFSSMTIYSFI